MFIQARRTVEVERWSYDSTDPFGNPAPAWADPVPVKVYGWEPPKSDEPVLAGHDRVVVDLQVLAPPGVEVGSHDRVIVQGRRYEVVGEIEDAGNGPFAFNPGARFNLRRVEG